MPNVMMAFTSPSHRHVDQALSDSISDFDALGYRSVQMAK
jgi:hypothetical protein